jgi:imidazolonepropionase-like amidohydrolase
MKALLTVWLCLATFLWAGSKAKTPTHVLIFTNVNVVNMHNGVIARGMTVVIKQGRIAGVAKLGFVAQGPEIQIVNADGKYMIPGLWDMHVHSAFVSPAWDEKVIYPLYIANGDRQTIGVNTPEEARQAVDTIKKRGLDFVKVLSVSRDSYFAIADESAKQNISFVGHVPHSVSVREAAVAGQKSIEHLTGVLLACSSREDELRAQGLAALTRRDYAAYRAIGAQIISSYDPAKAGALFLQLAKSNTWQVPTLVWTETNSHVDDPELKSDPRLKYVPASVRTEWDPAKLLGNTSLEELAALKTEAARDLELVAAMRSAGVRFMAGSDGPDPYVFPGFSLHDELEWLVKSGFSPLQALQAATLNPALFLAKSDKYGGVEVDHAADLLLLEANPLDDIRNTRRIFGVVAGGKYYSRRELDTMLQQVEKLAAQQ